MKVDLLLFLAMFFTIEWVSPTSCAIKMAASDVNNGQIHSNQRHRYDRDVLTRLFRNLNNLPCPHLPDFVPQNNNCSVECYSCQNTQGRLLLSPSWTPDWSCDVNKTRPQKRGQRGVIRIRLRKTKNTLPLPSIMTANV